MRLIPCCPSLLFVCFHADVPCAPIQCFIVILIFTFTRRTPLLSTHNKQFTKGTGRQKHSSTFIQFALVFRSVVMFSQLFSTFLGRQGYLWARCDDTHKQFVLNIIKARTATSSRKQWRCTKTNDTQANVSQERRVLHLRLRVGAICYVYHLCVMSRKLFSLRL